MKLPWVTTAAGDMCLIPRSQAELIIKLLKISIEQAKKLEDEFGGGYWEDNVKLIKEVIGE